MNPPLSLAAWLAGQSVSFLPAPDVTVPGFGSDRPAVVGVGLTVRTARPLVHTSHAIMRTLIQQAGFRAVFIEGTDTTSSALDRYVTSGAGDLLALVRESQSFLQTRETVDLLQWLRSYAQDHPDDPVSVVHDKHPARPARSLEEIERRLARRDLDWHDRTGQHIVHLGGVAHMIVGDPRLIAPWPSPGNLQRNAGARLRQVLGDRYTAVALSVGHGHVPFPLPDPDASFTESAFTTLEADCLITDLHADPTPSPQAMAWLTRPLRMRCVGPGYDPSRDREFYVEAGPLTECIDRLVYIRQAEATTAL